MIYHTQVLFGNGLVESVRFPEDQKVAENNVLRAMISALQMDNEGALEKGVISGMS